MKRSDNGLGIGAEVVVLRDIHRVPNSEEARADWHARIPKDVVQGGMDHKWEEGHPAWEAYVAACTASKAQLLEDRKHQLYAKAGERGVVQEIFTHYDHKHSFGKGVKVLIGKEIKTFRRTSLMAVDLYREKFGDLP